MPDATVPPEAGARGSILILGIGNLLLADEGVGVHSIAALQRQRLPPGVDLLDGGTGGFHLLECLRNYREVILIDATVDGRAAGTVAVTKPQFLSDYPRSLGAHDIGLRDLIESAALLGSLPTIHLITVSIAEDSGQAVELTPPVQSALPEVVAAVRRVLHEAGLPR